MKTILGTLLTDGRSDRVLVRVLEWLLKENGCPPCEIRWADLSVLPKPPSLLSDKIKDALELNPCEVLFVHRDAERRTIQERKEEISQAISKVSLSSPLPHVCVVPVRMTEAWMLFDEDAIRRAASNPQGENQLGLPLLKNVERAPNPKKILYKALKMASGLKTRRLEKFNIYQAAYRVMDYISEFSLLRQLHAFQDLEKQIIAFIKAI